jgi:hypothetical protein
MLTVKVYGENDFAHFTCLWRVFWVASLVTYKIVDAHDCTLQTDPNQVPFGAIVFLFPKVIGLTAHKRKHFQGGESLFLNQNVTEV